MLAYAILAHYHPPKNNQKSHVLISNMAATPLNNRSGETLHIVANVVAHIPPATHVYAIYT